MHRGHTELSHGVAVLLLLSSEGLSSLGFLLGRFFRFGGVRELGFGFGSGSQHGRYNFSWFIILNSMIFYPQTPTNIACYNSSNPARLQYSPPGYPANITNNKMYNRIPFNHSTHISHIYTHRNGANLWLGDHEAASDPDLLRRLSISAGTHVMMRSADRG